MSKSAGVFDLALPPRDQQQPAYRWLSAALRDRILAGRLRPGTRLPATRDLANQYILSRGTIVRAFDELRSEGYIEGSIGSGTYVSHVLPDDLLSTKRTKDPPQVPSSRRQRKLSNYGSRAELFSNFDNRPSRAFRANVPAIDLFPIDLWAQITARRLRRASTSLLLVCDAMGYLPLRRTVADYLMASRGVKCIPEQVAIVAGTQQSLDLTTRLFVNPGDRVCMEDPGYTGAANVFKAVGAKVVPVEIDGEGMKFDERKLKGARLLYTTPGHQFPLGITMSLQRRLQLLQWARESNAIIFEDDYDSEYRYLGRPVPALQGLDSYGVVLFAGSFSKVLFPSLRLGYIVVPPDLVERFTSMFSITCRHAPLLDQAILCDFISGGHFGRHLRRMRQIYSERLSALLEGAKQSLTGLLEITGIEAGLQTVGWLSTGIDAESAAAAAAKRNVDVTPLHHYSQSGRMRKGLQLGFAAFDVKEIQRGIRQLAIALENETAAS